MTPELSRRIAHAFRVGRATIVERDRLTAAAALARTTAELPYDMQVLLSDLETRISP